MIGKEEFVKKLAANLETTNVEAKRSLEGVLETLQQYLDEGQAVKFVGFGVFEVKVVKERIGTDPRNGKKIKIPAHRKVNFRMGQNMKNRMG